MNARSLILVTVDCLRADHVGFLGCERPTTPFLDSLAAESFVFSNAIVGGAPTYYSFPTILASRYPLALGRDIVGLAPGEPTLASVLKAAGYRTACFSAANPYLSRQFGYDQGFDGFHDFLDAENAASSEAATPGDTFRSRVNRRLAALAKRAGPLGAAYDELYFQYCQRIASPKPQALDALRRFPAADAVVSEACAWLASNSGPPIFLWLHPMDPHAPYYPAEETADLLGRKKWNPFRVDYVNASWNRGDIGALRLQRYREEIVELYDAGIRWVDTQVARLRESLRQLGLWDDCTFALTADHGEEFLDHGGRFHAPTQLTEELIRVPLLVRAPGIQGRIANSTFSQLHLAPTLLESVGIVPPGDFQGQSYWRQLQRGEDWSAPAIVECVKGCTNPLRVADRMGPRLLAVRDERFKLVVDCGSGSVRLFDLKLDPKEKNAVAEDAEWPVRKRFLELAHVHLRSSPQSRQSERLQAVLAGLRQTLVGTSPREAAHLG